MSYKSVAPPVDKDAIIKPDKEKELYVQKVGEDRWEKLRQLREKSQNLSVSTSHIQNPDKKKTKKREPKQANPKDSITINRNLSINTTGTETDHIPSMKRTIETTSIDEELQKGNFQKAEQLSDTMQNELNLQEKKKLDIIARYTKELEDKSQNKKKKPKLHWGLDSKERWEQKGNM